VPNQVHQSHPCERGSYPHCPNAQNQARDNFDRASPVHEATGHKYSVEMSHAFFAQERQSHFIVRVLVFHPKLPHWLFVGSHESTEWVNSRRHCWFCVEQRNLFNTFLGKEENGCRSRP
jgi:hypothetical protein